LFLFALFHQVQHAILYHLVHPKYPGVKFH
jgi:hypothetical protein